MHQDIGNSVEHDYGTKLLIYLAGRLKWDSPEDGQYLTISRRTLHKNLELFGKNSSRNNKLSWRTVDDLTAKGSVLSARELPGKRKSNFLVESQINPEKIRLHLHGGKSTL